LGQAVKIYPTFEQVIIYSFFLKSMRMKKFILCLIFLATAALGFSQSQRFVMFEEFTQASCGPCASYNPAFDALLVANATKCTSIKYHTNWPGVDPMNAQNPTEVASRVAYYNCTYVPYAVMDGTGEGTPNLVNQAMIDAEYLVPSTFDLSMYHYLSAGNDSIFVTMLGVCTQAVSSTLVGQIAVIEKHIHFNTPPGSNGEKDFYNVMKKMLPNASGTVLSNSFATGDYFVLQYAWKLANVYDLTQLSAVGFIQNNANKNVHQGANSSTTLPVMPYGNDVQVLEASGYSTTNCSGTLAPVVTIRNNGNNPVTSLTIKYSVNNGTLASYSWNGNITTLNQTSISLPSYSFTPGATNTLKIYTDLVNNVTDEYPKNDTTYGTITTSPPTTNYAKLIVRTDKAPEETTWNLKNSSGIVVDSGGPYALESHTYTDTVWLTGADCYTFTIFDAGNNGLCCVNGNGIYELLTSGGTVIKAGASFGASESTEVKMDAPASVEQSGRNSMKVYPNPVNGEARVDFYLSNPENVVLNLYNSTGQLVRSENKGSFPGGNQECTLNAQNLPSGIYVMKLQAGTEVHICKVSVSQ
jgi:hypothetical protein